MSDTRFEYMATPLEASGFNVGYRQIPCAILPIEEKFRFKSPGRSWRLHFVTAACLIWERTVPYKSPQ